MHNTVKMSKESFLARLLTRQTCLLTLGHGLCAFLFNFRILLYILNVNNISAFIVTELEGKLFLVVGASRYNGLDLKKVILTSF